MAGQIHSRAGVSVEAWGKSKLAEIASSPLLLLQATTLFTATRLPDAVALDSSHVANFLAVPGVGIARDDRDRVGPEP